MTLSIIHLLTAFGLGLASSLHCLVMCGGIMTALTLNLPSPIRSEPTRMFAHVLAYNLGRVGSYMVAGAVAAGLGGGVLRSLSPTQGHDLLSWFGWIVVVLAGVHLLGILPGTPVLERWGARFWRRVQPLAQRFVPAARLHQAFAFGALWGWLPCGLVYSALAWSAAGGSAPDGAAAMLAFGLGTLPAVASAGLAGGTLLRGLARPGLRRVMGAALIVIATAGLLAGRAAQHHDHAPLVPDTGTGLHAH